VFAALGDPTRLRLLQKLARGEALSTGRLAGRARVTRQAISKHLAVLEQAGLVRGVKEGRERRWALSPRKLAEARRCLDDVSTEWDAALERLRRFVED
jgi:DNA-binding transcriptional ArsR family regulator